MTTSRSLLFVSVLAAAAALMACAPADGESSSAGLPKGRVDAGALQSSVKGEATGQSCVDCHGADGNQPLDPTYPKIGGQYEDYLGHALQQYRSGQRDHLLMSNQAQGLTDQQIADLAAFFASQPSQLSDLSDVY